GRGSRDLRRFEPGASARDHVLEERRRRRAPLHLRRPLRVSLARDGGLRRQHRHDSRPGRPGAAAGGRALVGAWAVGGRAAAGGETPSWPGRHHRCHHPIRQGNRLYVSYWHGGFVILDVEDLAKPTFVSGLDWSPPFITPTHTAVPIPFPLRGRRVLLVADED